MRNRRNLVALAVAALIVAQGCASIFGRAGSEAREYVLAPAIEQAWPGVHFDMITGVNDALGQGQITAEVAADLVARSSEWDVALKAEEVVVSAIVALRARDWDQFEFYALQGIASEEAAGNVGPISAGELRERVSAFDEALASMSGEPTDPE